jgi:aminopeptidase N
MQPASGPGATPLRAKSIWILHMLRNIMRRDEGDVVFGRFIDEIFAEGRGSHISTFDIKRLAEKHAGRPLDWFFDSWVFGTGIPVYAMSSRVESTANGFVITGAVTQSGVPATFEMQVPVYADETFLGNVTVSGEGGEFRFTSRTMPQQILLDPNRVVLRQN